ncbi:uncharacterized protein LOC114795799 isoform X3 [Denticeps clupeoides]|uniref:uncharacterized protein LOC114795799 isoform X3 n=1 Tax=Denticeps clupeoides TaxID=299321 RepID=UPI0010A528FD|nr:uncharacterized protein LOC114795799 isoform X3 [Denticeps clupeoides]
MAAIGTWAFSQPAVEKMRSLVLAGHHATDVVETAMAGGRTDVTRWPSRGGSLICVVPSRSSEVENDKETGHHVVGRGGFPNNRGLVECDAAIMEGSPGRFGAVAALQGIAEPCRVARRVMDRSPHSLLVGVGAVMFAVEQGFTVEPNDNMLTPQSALAYQEFLEKKKSASGHDTLGLIALDLKGNITVAVSTSGAPFKSPGRVGDSPLPGCGLYADHRLQEMGTRSCASAPASTLCS